MSAPKVYSSPPVRVAAIRRRVDNLLEQQGKTTKWLFEQLGMSKTGYREMWDRETVRLVVLVQICACLGVQLDELLYDEATAHPVAEPTGPYKERRYLEDRVDELERIVAKLRPQTART